jgi:glutamate dehydrogenase
MSQMGDAPNLKVFDKVVKQLYSKLEHDEAVLIEEFIKRYYLSVSTEDLAALNLIDLYGALLSHWRFASERKPGEPKVRVYNPQYEQHGWQSTHTVIEIIHDDLPFVIDSVRMELNRRGLSIQLLLHGGTLNVNRDASHQITEILSRKTKQGTGIVESPLFLEIDRQSNQAVLKNIKDGIIQVLEDIKLSVRDLGAMSVKMEAAINLIPLHQGQESNTDLKEKHDFLDWLREEHFTFLGYCCFEVTQNPEPQWSIIPGSCLGVMHRDSKDYFDPFNDLSSSAQQVVLSKELIILGKTNKLSRVHRPVNTDFVAVKIFKDGNLVGLHCFIGLYTSAAYNRSPQHIPYLRLKVKKILQKASFTAASHNGKNLINILETFPRDDLFQAPIAELHKIAMGVLFIQERRRIKFFIRKDIFGHFFSCQVFVPREIFNSQLREVMQVILQEALQGQGVTFNTRFSESVLARIHFLVKIDPKQKITYDAQQIEERLIEAARTWEDNLKDALIDHYGEEEGNRLYQRYNNAFPSSYRDTFIARTAVYDITHIEQLNKKRGLAMSFYRPLEEPVGMIRFKLFHPDLPIPLSDIIPMLECMGLIIINQRPHEIKTMDKKIYWVNDFGMVHHSGEDLNVEAMKEIFQEAFYNIWHGNAESDGFNRLVLGVGLDWREVTMLRAYAKYLWQIGFTFSQSYSEETLVKNPKITRALVELFILRFEPTIPQESKNQKMTELRKQIKSELDAVENLDQDRILRRYLEVIMATIRTNYFQYDNQGIPKNYLSLKFDPTAISDTPLPKPMYEIFVYSLRVEGVHLRGAKVARGGIRWSDRREDFRTEVLGLMKAQQVKNAVIVPLGAKGGFVPKILSTLNSREEIQDEVIFCYETFIRGLLDITDNLVDNTLCPPENVVRYDTDDPYLVVAADKGTATFSDIANKISAKYNFWLGDAFASGGSRGYDHKKMGITARGAWESVKRHFRELNLDPVIHDFTVLGIGDMAGDVFGNGMLLSEHIKLIAAFNHQHIFIDPNPDPKASYQERLRIFQLPRSNWLDYDRQVISAGGGIYSRSAKSITLSPQVQTLLGLKQEKILPNELIRCLLKANVDLLWNGGIGTYVKAAYEHNAEVGDRANDSLRVNGEDLGCRVVGEGGNLGFTQLGRVEYALNGGCINTDAIDNSAGVDCSDHEVNIKILLNNAVACGDMTLKQRDQLLEDMTEEVAALVLNHNRTQNWAISLALLNSANNIKMFARLINYLEKYAQLNRKLEFLPDNEALQVRQQNHQGLTRPELSVLFAYAKTLLKEQLLSSAIPEDPYISQLLELAFPDVLQQQFKDAMYAHRLKRELIVTQVANLTINNVGVTFINRLQDETGTSPPEIICCYIVAREVFNEVETQQQIKALDFVIDAKIQLKMLHELNRLIRRATRWLLRHKRIHLNIQECIAQYQVKVERSVKDLRQMLKGKAKEYLERYASQLLEAGVPEALAYRTASMNMMCSALDIVDAAQKYELSLEPLAAVYFNIGSRLDLGWFREQIKMHPVTNHWDALARSAFRDDLDRQQRNLAIGVMQMEGDVADVEIKIDAWLDHNQVLVKRWMQMVNEIKSHANRNFTMYSVALRELLELAQASRIKAHQGSSNS